MPGAARRLAAGEDLRALADGVVDQLDHLLLGVGIDQRTDRHAVIEPIAHLQRRHLGGELLGKLVVHLLVHVETIGRGAGLAHVAHLGDHGALDRGIDVGVLEHDEGRIAAELHRRLDDVVGRLVQQLAPDLGRAGERDHAHARIMQHRAHHLARTSATGMTLTTPAGTPASSRIGISASMVSGVSEAGLSTTGQPAASAGPDLARRHGGGEIPRRHQHRDAGRLVLHHDAGARGRRAREAAEIAHRLLRVPAEELGGIGHFAARIRERLAVLDGDQLGEPLGVAHDQLEGLAQDFGALARLPAGPAREGIARGIDRGLGVLHGRARHRGDLVLGRGIENVEAAAVGGFAPLAADPEIGRNIGEKIVVSWELIGDDLIRCPALHRVLGASPRLPGAGSRRWAERGIGLAQTREPPCDLHARLPRKRGDERSARARLQHPSQQHPTASTAARARRCGRRSAARCLPGYRRPAAEYAAW